jgi:hypothetical protein
MAITIYPNASENQFRADFIRSKAFFAASSFGIANTIASPSANKKLVILGVRITHQYFGTNANNNRGVFVYRGTLIDDTKIIAHLQTYPDTSQFDFGSGIVLDANESISVAFQASSDTANLNVTIWGYEI